MALLDLQGLEPPQDAPSHGGSALSLALCSEFSLLLCL